MTRKMSQAATQPTHPHTGFAKGFYCHMLSKTGHIFYLQYFYS